MNYNNGNLIIRKEWEVAKKEFLFDYSIVDEYFKFREDYISTGKKSIIRNDNRDIISSGKTIAITNNSVMCKLAESFMDMGYEFKDSKMFKNKEFEARLLHKEKNILVGDERSQLMVVVSNSYDKNNALKVKAGVMIEVCKNGLMTWETQNMIFDKKEKDDMFTPVDVQTILNETEKYTEEAIGKKIWTNEKDEVEKITVSLRELLPENHSSRAIFDSRLELNTQVYGISEFAVMMTATDIATHGHIMGVPNTYVERLEKKSKEFLMPKEGEEHEMEVV